MADHDESSQDADLDPATAPVNGDPHDEWEEHVGEGVPGVEKVEVVHGLLRGGPRILHHPVLELSMPRRGFIGCIELAKEAAAGEGEHSPVRPARILLILIIRRGGREGGKEGGREREKVTTSCISLTL